MTHTAANVAAARAALERVAGDADAQRARLEPLAGGTHRRSWLVTFADGRRAVLRTPVGRSNALLELATETRAMDAAARAGVAPRVLPADLRMVRLMAWFWALLGEASADDASLYATYVAELGERLRQD